jgi:hypothetical protein
LTAPKDLQEGGDKAKNIRIAIKRSVNNGQSDNKLSGWLFSILHSVLFGKWMCQLKVFVMMSSGLYQNPD